MSIRQVADQSGVGRSTISRWERGDSSPNGPELIAVLRCLEPSRPGCNGGPPALSQRQELDPPFRGERLRQLRQDRGLSLQTVASSVGVSKATLSRWETGERQLSVGASAKLVELFGLAVERRSSEERSADPEAWFAWLASCVTSHRSRCLDLEFMGLDAVLRSSRVRSGDDPDLLAKVRSTYVLWLGWWYRDREAAVWAGYELQERSLGWDDPGIGRLIRARATYLSEYAGGPAAAARLLERAASALEGRPGQGFVLREFAGNLTASGHYTEAIQVLDRARRARLGDESQMTHEACCDLVEATIWLRKGKADRAYRSLPSVYPDDDMLRLSGTTTAARCLVALGDLWEAKRRLRDQMAVFRSKGLDHFATTLSKELQALGA